MMWEGFMWFIIFALFVIAIIMSWPGGPPTGFANAKFYLARYIDPFLKTTFRKSSLF